jgi:2-keto-3-deoxy-L-rhamnonate aldolase RhmA
MIDLSSRLASGDTLYGTFLGLGSALAAEACALAGFDWLLTDLEMSHPRRLVTAGTRRG